MAGPVVAGTTTAAVNGTSWSTPIPAGVTKGYQLVLAVSLRGNVSASVSSPWEMLDTVDRGGAGRLVIFIRTVTDLVPAAPTVTATGSGAHVSAMVAVRGVDPTYPIHNWNKASGTVTLNEYPVPSTVAYVPDCLVLRVAANHGTTSSFTWPAPVTEIVDYVSGQNFLGISSETQAAAGVVPAMTATASGSTSGYYSTLVLVIRPPASRLMLGSTPVPLMLGNTEVTIMGP